MSDLTYPVELPADLAEAQQQAMAALQAAILAGYQRLQVDILIPDLKPEVLGEPFLQVTDPPLAMLFSDAGGAALAQRDWGDAVPAGVSLQGLRPSLQIPSEATLVFVAPAVMAIERVEQLCDAAKGRDLRQARPAILLNPQLQDVSTVGVGLSGRRLRERFIKTFEPCYHLQSLAAGALFKSYPHPWSIWQQDDAGSSYRLLATRLSKPSGEELAQILAPERGPSPLEGLRRFLQALRR